MASVQDSKSAVEPGHERKLFDALKETNDLIDDMLERLKTFWNLEGFYDSDSLSKVAIPAGKFAAEQIDIVQKLRHEIHEKMKTLESFLLGGDPIPPHKDFFRDVVFEIREIQESTQNIINDIEKNPDARSFIQTIQNLEKMEEE